MKVTKYAHACLLIEEGDVRIIADPGSWNETPDAGGVAAVIVTHEHQDHCDPAQIQDILKRNPGCRVIAVSGAGKVLEATGISFEVAKEGQPLDVNGVSVEAFGHAHAAIYGASPCENSGYLVAGKLFVPGDALHDIPNKKVEALALPTGGPWMKIAEAIDYAKAVKPKLVFPIHDAMYIESYRDGLAPRIIGGHLEPAGIEFKSLAPGESLEF